jgi:hypothetical protein
MWVFGSALNYLAMIVIKDSEFSEDDHEFLNRWAEALQVPVSTLIVRIVEATLDGDQYIAKRPRDED